MQQPSESDLREQVRRLQADFHAGLAVVRSAVESKGLDANAFFQTTALFDGPIPVTVNAAAFGESVRFFGSRDEMLRSIQLPAGSEVCELGVWKGAFSKRILKHFSPRVFHLFDLQFSGLDPLVRSEAAVILHEGDSGTAIATLADDSIDYAYVDGDHSYAGSRRDLLGILPKVRKGGYIQLNDYTPWSVLSGFPYGVMANVHDVLNRGDATMVGFALQPFGHHDVLLSKS
jgi:hypothetical protein